MMKHVSSLLLMAAIACLAQGCGSTPPDELQASVKPDRPNVWLDPVRSNVGVTGRSVLHCSAGECIILHYPPTDVDVGNLEEVLKFNPDSPDDDAELYIDSTSRWDLTNQPHVAINTFNCCTYAVGDVVGLTPNDWIKPTANGDTYYTVPMMIILDSYFDRLAVYKRPIRDWEHIATDPDYQADDVVCFVDTRSLLPAFAHAGKISKKEGRNLLVSKFGSGPIIRSTIKAMAVEYSASFDQIWIYRAKHRPSPHGSPKA